MRFALAGLAAAILITATSTQAAAPFTAPTLTPYLNNEINGLQLNHLYLQSLFELDATPFTIGAGVRSARASYLRSDGGVTEGGLGKALYLLAGGYGHPRTGFAIFGGISYARVMPTGFPNVLSQAGDNDEDFIPVRSDNVPLFFGIAYKGLALEVAQYATGYEYDADGAGRFFGGGCDREEKGCDERTIRPGAPVPAEPTQTENSDEVLLVNLEHHTGYSMAVLWRWLDTVEDGQGGFRKKGLVGFRALAQPDALVSKLLGAPGIGLNGYDQTLDYYGDRIAAINKARDNGEVLPANPKYDTYEVPVLSDNIANTGINGRLVFQALPEPLFRLAEVGYATQATGGRLVPQAGGRAKMFWRAEGFVPSFDAYAGLFWFFEREEPDDDDSGMSFYATYAYNSPDSLTFVPLPDAHVIGVQLVYGNPMGLPPPIPIIKYPPIPGRELAATSSPERTPEATVEESSE